MSIWEFSDYDYEALTDAIEATSVLNGQGIEQDEDMMAEMDAEYEKFREYTVTYRNEFTAKVMARSREEAEELAVLAKWESMMELHTNLLEVEEDK